MTKKLITGPEVRWNSWTEDEQPAIFRWYVLIANREQRLAQIKQKFVEAAAPIDVENNPMRVLTSGKIGNDLAYELFVCDSYRSGGAKDFPWSGVYQGRVVRDLALYPRKRGTLADYVQTLVPGE